MRTHIVEISHGISPNHGAHSLREGCSGICDRSLTQIKLARHQNVMPHCEARLTHHISGTAAEVNASEHTCLGCHGDQQELANKTKEASPNPHAPPHLPAGETQVCAECHHVHDNQKSPAVLAIANSIST